MVNLDVWVWGGREGNGVHVPDGTRGEEGGERGLTKLASVVGVVCSAWVSVSHA